MKESYRWINIFIRDLLLFFVILYVNYAVSYESWWAACLMGMQIVLMTWHLSDLLIRKRRVRLWNGTE